MVYFKGNYIFRVSRGSNISMGRDRGRGGGICVRGDPGGWGETGGTLKFSSSVGWDTASTVYPTKISSIPKIFFCKLATSPR